MSARFLSSEWQALDARQPQRVALVAITRHGADLARTLVPVLPRATLCLSAKVAAGTETAAAVEIHSGPLREAIPGWLTRFDQLVFFVSLGAVVRLIAPHLRSKDQDPGVLVVDDAGQYVIPVLSGHVGGANACAEFLAERLAARAVITTASDVGHTLAVDILGRNLGWQVEAPKLNVTRVSAHVVNGEPVAFVQEAGSPHWWTRSTPLPANIHRFTALEQVDVQQYRAVLWVTHRAVPNGLWQQLHERLVVYRPPREATCPD